MYAFSKADQKANPTAVVTALKFYAAALKQAERQETDPENKYIYINCNPFKSGDFGSSGLDDTDPGEASSSSSDFAPPASLAPPPPSSPPSVSPYAISQFIDSF